MNMLAVDERTVVFSRREHEAARNQILAPPLSTSHLAGGTIISHFKLIRMLGKGGMGTVYLAEDLTLGRDVAIKFMNRSVISEMMVDMDEEAPSIRRAITKALEQRFICEAKSAGKISHQNLAQIYEAHFESDEWYIVMEYVNGQALDVTLRDDLEFSLGQILSVFRQTVLGLKHAWGNHRIVHRDVKPANIMIKTSGQVKIVDLGLAKPLDEEHLMPATQPYGSALGTPPYASPEQARSDCDLDYRSDVFSLGATMYELCTDQRAFGESSAAAVYESQLRKGYKSIRELRPDLPKALSRLIDKMLEPDRANRYLEYGDILKALDRIEQPTDTVSIKVPKPIRRVYDGLAAIDYSYLLPHHGMHPSKILELPFVKVALAFLLVPLLLVWGSPGPSRVACVATLFGAVVWGRFFLRDLNLGAVTKRLAIRTGAIAAIATPLIFLLAAKLPALQAIYQFEHTGGTELVFWKGLVFIALAEEALKVIPLLIPAVEARLKGRVHNYVVLGMAIGFGFSLKHAVLHTVGRWSTTSTVDARTVTGTFMIFLFLPLLHAMWGGLSAWFLAAARREGRLQIGFVGVMISALLHGVWVTWPNGWGGLLAVLGTAILFAFYYGRIRTDSHAAQRLKIISAETYEQRA
jgi:serine/threonine protein kinase/RsiW-degrading membrane proteinase PrsW (M82 family)